MSVPPARVLVVGDVMTDIIVQPEGPLVVGSDRNARIRLKPGGSGANQAVWLAALGLDVRFAARVGHADVEALTAQFASWGVQAVLGADPDLPSGMLVTILDPSGERSFLTERGANATLGPADLPTTLLDGCRALVISGYALFEPGPRAAVTALMGEAKARTIPIAIDPASVGFLEQVGIANFLDWTSDADTVFANESEALALTGAAGVEDAMRQLGRRYRRVIIKRGAAGAILGGSDGIALQLPAPTVEVVDTTGAGDAFAAGFIAAELAGLNPVDCLARAIFTGAEAVTQLGGRPGQALPRPPASAMLA